MAALPTSRCGGGSRADAARLCCGNLLTYEVSTFVPAVGEVVPCRRHGYCRVTARETLSGRGTRRPARLAPARSQAELLAFLTPRPVISVHALRRHRFTLRLVAAAQRDGFLDVDLVSGRVSLRGRVDEEL